MRLSDSRLGAGNRICLLVQRLVLSRSHLRLPTQCPFLQAYFFGLLQLLFSQLAVLLATSIEKEGGKNLHLSHAILKFLGKEGEALGGWVGKAAALEEGTGV